MISKLSLLVLTFLLHNVSFAYSKASSEQLKYAIDKRRAGEHWQAVNILSELREKHLEHKRINIELILNFIRLRQYDKAETILLFMQSLTLSELEQQKLEKLKKILTKRIRKPISSHRWLTDVGASVGVDVVNNTFPVFIIEDYQFEDGSWLSDELNDQLWEDLDFGEVEYTDGYEVVTRDEETQRKESSYTSQFINVNYRYRPLDKLDWFTKPTYFIWDSNASAEFRQINNENNSKYERIGANTSLYFLSVNRWLAELSLRANFHYSEGNKLLSDSRQRIAISLPYQQHKFKFAADFGQKHYRANLNDNNAKLQTPWFEYSYALKDTIRLSVGYRHKILDANDEFLSYSNRNPYVGLYYYPFTDISAFLTVNYYQLRYKIDDPEVVNWAKEDKTSLAFGVKYYWNENLSFSVNGNYSKNKIELGFGEDDWRRLEASVTYRF